MRFVKKMSDLGINCPQTEERHRKERMHVTSKISIESIDLTLHTKKLTNLGDNILQPLKKKVNPV